MSLNILYVWIPLMFLISFGYMYYTNKKRKAAMANIDVQQEKSKAPVYQQEYLNGDYAFLKTWVENLPIEAFTSASIPLTLKDHASNMAKDVAKSAAFALVGVKARYTRVETPSYLVLTNGHLHLFTTDTDGELDGHLVFGPDTLQKATIQHQPAKKMGMGDMGKGAQELMPEKYDLNLELDNQKLTVQIHDLIETAVDPTSMFKEGYYLEVVRKRAVGSLLLQKLGETYPNLKADLAIA